MGDFKLLRSPENCNKPGGNVPDMFQFNDVISRLGLIEIPLKGRAFTWSNMQDDALLQKLDWVFTSAAWSLSFPNTMAIPLSRITSDHTPCLVQFSTSIPRASVFRFENFWVQFDSFLPRVASLWSCHPRFNNVAQILTFKLKLLRRGLKLWSKKLSNLSRLIENTSWVLALLDELEDQRPLCLVERNFRRIL